MTSEPSASAEGVDLPKVLSLEFGYSESSEGFALISDSSGWPKEVVGAARRLAELDPQLIGQQKRAFRFWGDFKVQGTRYAIGMSFEATTGRAGSFKVEMKAVPILAGNDPPEPAQLLAGQRAPLDRLGHLQAIAKMSASSRRAWLIQVVAMAVKSPGGCEVKGWSPVEHAARLLSVLPWSFGQNIEIVSSPAAQSFHANAAAYFDMSAELQEPGVLPDWVTKMCELLEQAVARPDEYAALLQWLDTEPPFEHTEAFYLALQISFDIETGVEAGVERVARWIGMHQVPKSVRVRLGQQCINTFLIAGADECLRLLPWCAEQWSRMDDGQGVVEELFAHLGSQIADSEVTLPDLGLLKALVALKENTAKEGGSRLVLALSPAFRRGAACKVGALEEWVEGFEKVQADLGENGVELRRSLVERIWSELDGLGWWERRGIQRLRKKLGGPVSDVDLSAALQVSKAVSRRVFAMLPRTHSRSLSHVLALAVSPDIDELRWSDTVRNAVGLFGSDLRRPAMLQGLFERFSAGVAGAELVYRVLWLHLSQGGYRAAGLELERGLDMRRNLKHVRQRLLAELPPSWNGRGWRRWWLLPVLLVLAFGAYCYFYAEDVAWIGEKLHGFFGSDAELRPGSKPAVPGPEVGPATPGGAATPEVTKPPRSGG